MSINWRLDLLEGIDLLGSFEPLTVRAYRGIVRPGDTVLDIGANVGAHTLPLAQLVGETCRVIAPVRQGMKVMRFSPLPAGNYRARLRKSRRIY